MALAPTVIDPLSATSIRLQPLFNDIKLAVATGFTIKHNGMFYLITNWHVATGRDADTKSCLNKNAAIPNKLVASFHSKTLGKWIDKEIPLIDDNGNNTWIEHPLGSAVDVVAIPLNDYTDTTMYALDLALADVDLVLMPAMPISVIGYPLGLTSGENWPIWKTGHIATDPDIDFQPNRPAFLIDATTRSGMSGSPVVVRATSGYTNKQGNQMLGMGVTTKFIGVYSGRIHDESEIGRVWRPFVINEVLDQKLHFDEKSRRTMPNRNSKCSCNSGRQFKSCCGALA